MAVGCKALCKTVAIFATFITLNIVIYMPDTLAAAVG